MIEPCCAERQLAELLRKNNNTAVFQHAGDVTFGKMMHAIFLLSGDRPRTLIVALPTVTADALRPIAHFIRSGWARKTRLLIPAADVPLVTATLAPAVGDAPTTLPQEEGGVEASAAGERLELYTSEAPISPFLLFSASDGTVLVTGEIPAVITPSLYTNAITFARKGTPAEHALLSPYTAYIKSRKKATEAPGKNSSQSQPIPEYPSPSQETPASPAAPEAPEAPSKKKSRKK